MLIIFATLLFQLAIAVFLVARYPQSLASLLRVAAAAIDAAGAAGRGRTTETRAVGSRIVKVRRTVNRRVQASKKSARQLEAPSDRLEGDLIRALVRLGSSESAARLHVLGLTQKGLIRPDMPVEQALSVAFQQLKPSTNPL